MEGGAYLATIFYIAMWLTFTTGSRFGHTSGQMIAEQTDANNGRWRATEGGADEGVLIITDGGLCER